MAQSSCGIGMKSSRIHPKANNVKTDQPGGYTQAKTPTRFKSCIKLTLSKVMENEMPIEV